MPVIAYLMIPDEQLIQELLRMQKEDFSLYQELVHDVRIKRKIIYTQEETVFTISVSNPQLQTDLYDDTGLSLLSNSYSSKIIRYLWIFLENAKEHLSRYMNNENFLSLLYRCHHGYTDLYMPYLDYESFLLNYSYRIKEDTDVVWLLRNANEDVITHFLEEGKISKEDMLSLLEHGSATVISTLLRFDMRISSLDYLSCKEWSDLLKKGVTIPVRLLEEPRILKKLTRMNSVKSYRLLIELLR